jgi:uncharacterized damage-inducible protein DinB
MRQGKPGAPFIPVSVHPNVNRIPGGKMSETMTPEQAVFLRDSLMGTLKNESRTTKAVLAAVPDAKCDYRPDPISKSAYELVRHVAASDVRFVESVVTGAFNTDPKLLPEEVKSCSQVSAWYEERYAKAYDALSKLSGEQLAKIIDFRGLFQRPAVTFLIFGLTHSVHHRGQLSAYLRSMDAKVPAIYGESYDSAKAKQAAG